MAPPDRYSFGSFVLERSQQRVLRGDGSELALQPKAFAALLLFVEHAGNLLDKDQLMRSLWPGLVVEENNLSQVISGLRRALGDEPHGSRFIQTVPRRGFRFIAPVVPIVADVQPAGAASEPAPPRAAEAPVGPDAPQSAATPSSRRLWLRGAAASGAALGLAGLGWWTWRTSPTESPPAPAPATTTTTLAVLPFKPLTAEGRDELLEVGMADSLGARLSIVPGLVVRSTAAVLRHAGPGQDPLKAARELDVSWIVDGTLQRRGDQLRVTARLLRAVDGTAAWSGSFDEQLANVFDVQDQISTRVMHAVLPALQAGAATNAHLAELGGTRSTEAYQLYLAAAWRAQDMRSGSPGKAIELLQQALAIDPDYALAWAQLAWVHRRKLWRNDARPSEVFAAADAALQRALALTPELAQARAELAWSLFIYQFDWDGAEREHRRALAANPSAVGAQFGLGMLLVSVKGRADEGMTHMRLARELEPMSPVVNTVEASLLMEQGRLDAAGARLDRVFAVAPDHGLAHLTQGLLWLDKGEPGEGIAALRRAVAFNDGATRPRAVLAASLAALGQRDEAQDILRQMLELSDKRFVPPSSLATIHAALGEPAAALDALERGVEVRDLRLAYLKDDRAWVPLRREARYLALLKRLGLDRFGPGLTPI